MSRVFWDSMLFIYLTEGNPEFYSRCRYLLQRSYERGDSLFTSHLVLGEVLAGAEKSPFPEKTKLIREIVREMEFTPLPFDEGAVLTFSELRAKRRLGIADSINLACAASAGMDVFLTGDKKLPGQHIPGVQFVVDFQTQLL
jgi:predicted nucleic acid-binding protein